jgi:hypothetical protein
MSTPSLSDFAEERKRVLRRIGGGFVVLRKHIYIVAYATDSLLRPPTGPKRSKSNEKS